MYRDHKGCSLTLSMDDIKTSWETEQWECDATEIIEAFYGVCVGQTFAPQVILSAMREFAEEHLEVFEKQESDSE